MFTSYVATESKIGIAQPKIKLRALQAFALQFAHG